MKNETPLVTVVLPTTGAKELLPALVGLSKQTLNKSFFKVLLVIDGNEYKSQVNKILKLLANNEEFNALSLDIIQLPDNTGANNFNGHRIYGATSFLVNTPYTVWHDQDNVFSENHLESLLQLVTDNNLDWAHSLRRIIAKEGEFICNDDCECLGVVQNILGDHLIDTSCFIVRTNIAWQLSTIWYRRARQHNVMSADRLITKTLIEATQSHLTGGCTGLYSVDYRVGNRSDSVTGEFFIRGNAKIKEAMNGVAPYPWAMPKKFVSNKSIENIAVESPSPIEFK